MAILAAAAWGQTYPSKPVRMIVPFAPGGNVDINARAVAPAMSEVLGQTVIVDNRAGAGGIIGSDVVAKSPPDGYTVLMASNSVYGVAPNLYRNTYNPTRDFTGVVLLSSVPFVIVVHPSVPARSVKEMVAVAKQDPKRLTLASAGVGTTNHLVGELFQMTVGTRMTPIPYKGSGPALVDLVAGHVDVHVDQLTSSIGYVRSHRIRAIAVTTNRRSPSLPDVPTLDEGGLKGFDATTATGILSPAGTPREVVGRLHTAALDALKRPAVRERFTSLGAEIIGGGPDQFTAYVKDDFAKWGRVIRDANIRIE
jgi:tripartite-type tricarboxylate transporter receptor subunit TctC